MTLEFTGALPQKFVTNVVSLCGKTGETWLRDLPATIVRLETEWSITAGTHFPTLSYNYVAAATTREGEPAVLKIGLPIDHPEIFGEARYLRLSDGHACSRLLAHSRANQAILIERAVPGRNLHEIFRGCEDDALPVLIDVLSQTRRPAPVDTSDLILLDDWFDGLRRAAETDFPASHALRALSFYEELSSDKRAVYLLHGDLHHENILSATRSPYLAIDPKAIIGHLGYEIAVFLNNHLWWVEWKPDAKASLRRAADLYAGAFDVPSLDLRKWAFCQMVLGTWWSYDEMNESYTEGLGFADMWGV